VEKEVIKYLAGRTYSLGFNFFDSVGDRTTVDIPTAIIYTPERTSYIETLLTADSLVIGKYNYNFHVASGLTFGQWFAVATGITNSTTLFSEVVPFEIINIRNEPLWVGLTEFREYLDISDGDHTRDGFYKQILQAAISLVEAYTRRTFGVKSFNETIEIQHTNRIKLKHFPIVNIVAMTATTLIRPMQVDVFNESLTSSVVPFHFRLDTENGIIKITNSSGFDDTCDNIILAVSYNAGFLSVPEGVRLAVLALASKLSNMATSEGIESIRLADLNFALQKDIISGSIADMLNVYKIIDL
jgi:hypothetical protein